MTRQSTFAGRPFIRLRQGFGETSPQREARRRAGRQGCLVLAALVAAATIATSAQVKPGASAADVALYTGADRMEKLIAGAKKEGSVSIYTSLQTADIGKLGTAFEKKYGVKVIPWRAGSENIVSRAVQEARANRNTVDVIETNGPELESMHRENILQAVKSPYLADLIGPAILPHGEWTGTRLNVFVQAYNTRQIKKADLPKTWEDLANPKWKGKIGIEQEDSDWLAGVFADIGDARARKVFKDIVTANGISVRKGHTLLSQLVVSGEVPLALTVYNYKAEQLKKQGAPIDWFVMGNAIARPNGIGVARKAPHPHAAVLFYDFELSPEGQQIVANLEFVPTSKKIDTPLNKVPMKFVDAKVAIDEYDKWKGLYRQLFNIRGS
jgi:iron(III) transport system substrate-binding protein